MTSKEQLKEIYANKRVTSLVNKTKWENVSIIALR